LKRDGSYLKCAMMFKRPSSSFASTNKF
jgi:hypothetical protein